MPRFDWPYVAMLAVCAIAILSAVTSCTLHAWSVLTN
jgi:hypothetical protein